MQKNAIFIFQKLNFLNYTFHIRIYGIFLNDNFQFQNVLKFKFDNVKSEFKFEN